MRRRGSNSTSGRRNNNYSRGGGNSRGYSKSNRARKSIDPRKFVKAAKFSEAVQYVPENQFKDLEITDLLKANLVMRDYIVPTQIQDKAIPILLEGKDVVGIANTGTGKTAAFLLPILNQLIIDRNKKALIIAPTRELALQIEQECREFARGSRLLGVLLIGGVPIGPQLRDLRSHPEIVIGTPGRLKDHVKRGSLNLQCFRTIVLDEVDRMLDMGFITDIRMILQQMSPEKQSMFFSATMSPSIENLIQTFAKSPVTIMARTAETSDNVEQSIMHYYENTDKISKLHELLAVDRVEKTLIFCETKRSTERLSKDLVVKGFTSDAIHGNKSQSQRQRALKSFKDGHVDILVATDVAARGIDVDGITHVINYDIPNTYDDYTHRIGRTGRVGKIGHAITFVTH
jgi:superfamily II DNA/RNA helicase